MASRRKNSAVSQYVIPDKPRSGAIRDLLTVCGSRGPASSRQAAACGMTMIEEVKLLCPILDLAIKRTNFDAPYRAVADEFCFILCFDFLFISP